MEFTLKTKESKVVAFEELDFGELFLDEEGHLSMRIEWECPAAASMHSG